MSIITRTRFFKTVHNQNKAYNMIVRHTFQRWWQESFNLRTCQSSTKHQQATLHEKSWSMHHQIMAHIVSNNKTAAAKIAKCRELFNKTKRTTIYSFDLCVGNETASKSDLSFIKNAIKDRTDAICQNYSFFHPRHSLKEFHTWPDQIIGTDSHFGSRRRVVINKRG